MLSPAGKCAAMSIKTMHEVVPKVMTEMRRLPTAPLNNTINNSLPISKDKMKKENPHLNLPQCKTAWQQKWLALRVTSPGVQVMADEAKAFISRWIARLNTGPRLLVIAGPSGCGKTHCAKGVSANAKHISMHGWESGA